MSEIYTRIGATDPMIGLPFAEIVQSQDPVSDRVLFLERECRRLWVHVKALEIEVELLKRRTWWSMLKEMFR